MTETEHQKFEMNTDSDVRNFRISRHMGQLVRDSYKFTLVSNTIQPS